MSFNLIKVTRILMKEQSMEKRPKFLQKSDPPTTEKVSAVSDLQLIPNMPSQIVNQELPTSIQVSQEGTEAPLLNPSSSGELASSNKKESDKLSSAGYSGGVNPSDTNISPTSFQDSRGFAPSFLSALGSIPPSQPPAPFQTVDNLPTSPMDAASATLMGELRQVTDVEDLSGQFEHTRRKGVARGGYSEVYMTHLRDHTHSNFIQVSLSA